jgi:circadian clock protein KaiC
MEVDRVSTGVDGLDRLMEGGFVRGSINLVTGKTGTGKTAFSSSFLYAGALEGEVGVYLTTEEGVEDIKSDIAAMFGWDFDSLEKKNLIVFLPIKPKLPHKTISESQIAEVVKLYMFDILSQIEDVVKKYKAKRLVVDSISIVEMFLKDPYLRKVALIQFTDKLKELGVTTLLTGTTPEATEKLSLTGVIEFLVDSVIKLDFVPVAEEFKRTLTIRKMRRTNHSILIHPFEITKTGLKIVEIK